MKLSLPEKDGVGKLFAVIQLIVFLALFLGIYLILRRFVHALILRILVLLGDYFVVSLFLYLVVKPLCDRAENAMRNKKN